MRTRICIACGRTEQILDEAEGMCQNCNPTTKAGIIRAQIRHKICAICGAQGAEIEICGICHRRTHVDCYHRDKLEMIKYKINRIVGDPLNSESWRPLSEIMELQGLVFSIIERQK